MRECLHLATGAETIFLRKRYGFVKLALQHGAHLVPAFAFGQSDAFRFYRPRLPFGTSFLARRLGCAPILFWGRCCSPIPFAVPITIYVGTPIPVTKVAEPSDAAVSALLHTFIEAMQALVEANKAAAGYPDMKLIVL